MEKHGNNFASRKDARHAKKNMVFHAETKGHQVNIIIPWRALRLCESNIVL